MRIRKHHSNFRYSLCLAKTNQACFLLHVIIKSLTLYVISTILWALKILKEYSVRFPLATCCVLFMRIRKKHVSSFGNSTCVAKMKNLLFYLWWCIGRNWHQQNSMEKFFICFIEPSMFHVVSSKWHKWSDQGKLCKNLLLIMRKQIPFSYFMQSVHQLLSIQLSYGLYILIFFFFTLLNSMN